MKEWYKVGTDAWGNYGPVEVYIVGTSEADAEQLEDDYCTRH